MMTKREMIDVMEAYERGEVIQGRGETGPWQTLERPTWNFGLLTYRVKPKEREWWLVVQTASSFQIATCSSRQHAAICRLNQAVPTDYEIVHVREIRKDSK